MRAGDRQGRNGGFPPSWRPTFACGLDVLPEAVAFVLLHVGDREDPDGRRWRPVSVITIGPTNRDKNDSLVGFILSASGMDPTEAFFLFETVKLVRISPRNKESGSENYGSHVDQTNPNKYTATGT